MLARNISAPASASTDSIRLPGISGLLVCPYGSASGSPGSSLLSIPVEPRKDLARHIEVGIGQRLARAVFDMGRAIAGAAHQAAHRTFVVDRPYGALGRKRIGIEPLVAVDGGVGKSRAGADMFQQAAGEKTPELRDWLFGIEKGIARCHLPRQAIRADARPQENTLGNPGLVMKEAISPMRRATCLTARRISTTASAASIPINGSRVISS